MLLTALASGTAGPSDTQADLSLPPPPAGFSIQRFGAPPAGFSEQRFGAPPAGFSEQRFLTLSANFSIQRFLTPPARSNQIFLPRPPPDTRYPNCPPLSGKKLTVWKTGRRLRPPACFPVFLHSFLKRAYSVSMG
ncbi:hypothetical protein IMSAGC013_04186 [Lachnospiraceae bacterium]|nr:hypothetical protein IMSAGC013_04186 [Lachnospiraceae bacterium]